MNGSQSYNLQIVQIIFVKHSGATHLSIDSHHWLYDRILFFLARTLPRRKHRRQTLSPNKPVTPLSAPFAHSVPLSRVFAHTFPILRDRPTTNSFRAFAASFSYKLLAVAFASRFFLFCPLALLAVLGGAAVSERETRAQFICVVFCVVLLRVCVCVFVSVCERV